MSDARKRWEGQVVDRKFPLLQYLGGSEHSAVFLTERREGERVLRAAIKLVPAVGEGDELQLSRWRQAAELSHPHLISIFESGRCELREASLLYVVMEFAEENLAQVLANRALEPAEASAMLESVLDVLSYLHGHGFVHGHIKPTNIMASGEQLKVSGDGLRRAGESAGGPGRPDAYDAPEYARGTISAAEAMTPAGDVWSVGVTLVEALTQSLPTVEHGDPPLSQTLPQPFLDIARHCLLWDPQSRWTVAQIGARLQGKIPVSQPRSPAWPSQATGPLQPSVKRHRYALLVAVGLLVAAAWAGTRLLHRHSEASQASSVALQRAAAEPIPKQETPGGVRPAVGSELGDTEPGRETTGAMGREPIDAAAHGEVLQQVMPDVLESARDTIRGTVTVSVKVDVDRSGAVENADLETPGPSVYFARRALQAAQLWKFKPPQVAGQNILSIWTLRFQFTRDGTVVVPTQQIP